MPASPWGHSAGCQLPSVFRSGRAFEAPQGLPSSSPHSPHVTPDSHLQAPPQPFPRHWLESLLLLQLFAPLAGCACSFCQAPLLLVYIRAETVLCSPV